MDAGVFTEPPDSRLHRGDGTGKALACARDRVTGQPWVQNLSMSVDDGLTCWQVSVSDDAAAEDLLLRLIFEDRNLKEKHFGRKTYNLEEVFLELVAKENSK